MKPMLAHTIKSLEDVEYPCLVSAKLDGIRCLVFSDGRVLSRSLKPIRNHFIRCELSLISKTLPEGSFLDGELMCGDNFQDATSGIMTIEGKPDYTYYVFDWCKDESMPFTERFNTLSLLNIQGIEVLPHTLVNGADEAMTAYLKFMGQGYEGLILRRPDGQYKFGRSTAKQGILGKLKAFMDKEFTVIGYKQEFKNFNEQTKDELGHSVRSTAKDGKIPMESLGALTVTDGVIEFDVGSGMTRDLKRKLWLKRDELHGKLVKVKYFDYGIKEKPRHPVFLGFRDETDL